MNPATNVKSIVPYIGSMNFDGVDDACTIADSAIPASAFHDGFVLFGWINPRGWGGTNVGSIFQKDESTLALNGFYFSVEGISAVNRLRFKLGPGGNVVAANNSIHLNRWQHVIVHVSANGNVSFYINGLPSGTPAISSVPTNVITSNPLTIGNRPTATDRAFDGRMAQLGILSLAGRGDLTQDEITALYLHNVIPAGTKLLHLETTANQIKGDQWLDKSGNNNHATIVGPTFSYEAPTKRIAQLGAPRQLDGRLDGVVSGGVTIADGAMLFDGVDGRINCGNSPLIQTFPTITLYSWVNVSAVGGSSQVILEKRAGTNNRYSLSIGTDSRIYFTISNGTTAVDCSFPVQTFPLVGCIHAEYNGVQMRIYVNNILVATQSFTGTITVTTSNLFLGARTGSTLFLNGSISQLGILNKSTDLTERTAIFNAGPNAPCPVKRGLVAEYSGRDYEGPAATPTKIFDVASWDGLNVQD